MGVDPRQWHAEYPKASANSKDLTLSIVLRKVEQGERWPEVFDTSPAAVAAEREPVLISSHDIIAPVNTSSVNGASTDHTAGADTAAGMDAEVVEDSAELDIAAPTGAPVAL